MDLELKNLARSLMTVSRLEKGRVTVPSLFDTAALANFKELEPMIEHEMRGPKLLKAHTPAGNPKKDLTPAQRNFRDQKMVDALLQARNRVKPSSRIIRNSV